MRVYLVATMLAWISVMLTGCWDVKDLDDYNFVTALGIERKNDKYAVYSEILDVGSVGKKEAGSVSDQKSVWVGKAEGDTVMEAMIQISRTSQQRLMWDHVVVMILSDTMLKEDLTKVLGGIFRFREIRYTPWLFVTRGTVEKIMHNPPFINETPMATLSHRPDEIFKQSSPFIPVRLLSFVRTYQEPGATLLIPSLQIDETSWKNEGKPQSVLTVDGAFAVQQSNAAWLSNDELEGLLRTTQAIRQTPLIIKHGKQAIGTAKLGRPHTKMKVSFSNGRPVYSMSITVKGYIQEMTYDRSEAEIKADIEQEIKSQVVATYKAAIAKQTDIYQFEHYLYRKHNAEWKRLKAQNQNKKLDADSLAKVDVNLQLTHSGIYQLND